MLHQKQYQRDLEKVANWLVYAGKDPRFPCRVCSTPDASAGLVSCPNCFGTRQQVRLERVQAIVEDASMGRGDAMVPVTQAGITLENLPSIYTSKWRPTQIGDLFFMVEWNVPNNQVARCGRPTNTIQVYEVRYCDSFYSDHLIGYVSYCTFRTESLRLFSETLSNAKIYPPKVALPWQK